MILDIKNIPSEISKQKVLPATKVKAATGKISGISDKEIDSQPTKDFVLDQETLTDCWRMVRAVVDYGGIGLAATQLGINKNIFLIQIDGNTDKFQFFFEPSWSPINQETFPVPSVEECLSVPGYRLEVPRVEKIMASWFEISPNGILTHKVEFISSFYATVFQHEFDHLKGVSIVDKTKQLNRKQKRSVRKALT